MPKVSSFSLLSNLKKLKVSSEISSGCSHTFKSCMALSISYSVKRAFWQFFRIVVTQSSSHPKMLPKICEKGNLNCTFHS